MTFQPGAETTRGPGRPKGSVNRRTQEILDLIKERGDVDPLVALSEIVSTSQIPEHRISASNILAPYLHSKRGKRLSRARVRRATVLPSCGLSVALHQKCAGHLSLDGR